MSFSVAMPTNQRVSAGSISDADLVDVADEIVVDRADARAAVRREDHEAFAAQQLQRFAHRIGGGAESLGEIGDHEAFIGLQPAR